MDLGSLKRVVAAAIIAVSSVIVHADSRAQGVPFNAYPQAQTVSPADQLLIEQLGQLKRATVSQVDTGASPSLPVYTPASIANAKGDGQQMQCLVTASTSSLQVTISAPCTDNNGNSILPNFTTANLGEEIDIGGIGTVQKLGAVPQAGALTSIISGINGSVITIGTLPVTAVTSTQEWVTWGANDAAAINQALNASGTVFPAGAPLTIDKNYTAAAALNLIQSQHPIVFAASGTLIKLNSFVPLGGGTAAFISQSSIGMLINGYCSIDGMTVYGDPTHTAGGNMFIELCQHTQITGKTLFLHYGDYTGRGRGMLPGSPDFYGQDINLVDAAKIGGVGGIRVVQGSGRIDSCYVESGDDALQLVNGVNPGQDIERWTFNHCRGTSFYGRFFIAALGNLSCSTGVACMHTHLWDGGCIDCQGGTNSAFPMKVANTNSDGSDNPSRPPIDNIFCIACDLESPAGQQGNVPGSIFIQAANNTTSIGKVTLSVVHVRAPMRNAVFTVGPVGAIGPLYIDKLDSERPQESVISLLGANVITGATAITMPSASLATLIDANDFMSYECNATQNDPNSSVPRIFYFRVTSVSGAQVNIQTQTAPCNGTPATFANKVRLYNKIPMTLLANAINGTFGAALYLGIAGQDSTSGLNFLTGDNVLLQQDSGTRLSTTVRCVAAKQVDTACDNLPWGWIELNANTTGASTGNVVVDTSQQSQSSWITLNGVVGGSIKDSSGYTNSLNGIDIGTDGTVTTASYNLEMENNTIYDVASAATSGQVQYAISKTRCKFCADIDTKAYSTVPSPTAAAVINTARAVFQNAAVPTETATLARVSTTASGLSAASQAIINLSASYASLGILVGDIVIDSTTSGAIPNNTTVQSLGPGANQITASANLTGGGVLNGDTIYTGLQLGNTGQKIAVPVLSSTNLPLKGHAVVRINSEDIDIICSNSPEGTCEVLERGLLGTSVASHIPGSTISYVEPSTTDSPSVRFDYSGLGIRNVSPSTPPWTYVPGWGNLVQNPIGNNFRQFCLQAPATTLTYTDLCSDIEYSTGSGNTIASLTLPTPAPRDGFTFNLVNVSGSTQTINNGSGILNAAAANIAMTNNSIVPYRYSPSQKSIIQAAGAALQ